MRTVFWDVQSIIPLDFLEPGATVNSEHYIKTLIKLKARIARIKLRKNILVATQQCQATSKFQDHRMCDQVWLGSAASSAI